MKRIIRNLFLFSATFIFAASSVSAQEFGKDDILGIWLNEDEDAHIEVYKEGDLYFGKIIWLKFPIDEETGQPKLDKHHPDPELLILNCSSDNVAPDNGNNGNDTRYSVSDPDIPVFGRMPLPEEDYNKLKIRGYIGISLIGRTTYWTRVE